MLKQWLQIQQLDTRIKYFSEAVQVPPPLGGWIRAIRTALGMSLTQLGKKLDITKQSVQELEKREKDGNITLRSLKEVAKAMDMQLVYGFVPLDGSLDALVERKAYELAARIVKRTSDTMALEDQAASYNRLEKAVKERGDMLKQELPKILWD